MTIINMQNIVTPLNDKPATVIRVYVESGAIEVVEEMIELK
jgi:hypothetical protein